MALARAGKVSQAFLSHVEIGRCQNLSVGVLLRLAKARRVSPALLISPTPPTQARGPKFKSRRMRTPVPDNNAKGPTQNDDRIASFTGTLQGSESEIFVIIRNTISRCSPAVSRERRHDSH